MNDSKEGTVRRVRLYKIGDTILHPAEPTGSFKVTPAFALNMISAHAEIKDLHGYSPPALREHKEEGMQFGAFIDLMVDKYEDEDYICGDVDFYDGLEKTFDRGLIRNWSPSHFQEWVDPHTGKKYTYILAEGSMVGIPHLQNVGSMPTPPPSTKMSNAQFRAAASRAINPPPEEDGMTDEQIATMIEGQQQITQAIAGLPDSIASAVALALKPEGGGDGDSTEMMSEEVKTEMSALRAAQAASDTVVAGIRTEMGVIQARNAFLEVKTEAPGASDEDVQMLASMTPEQRKYTITQMSATATRAGSVQIGGGGSGVTTKPKDFRTACSAAKAAGIKKPGAALVQHMREEQGISHADYDAMFDPKVLKSVFSD